MGINNHIGNRLKLLVGHAVVRIGSDVALIAVEKLFLDVFLTIFFNGLKLQKITGAMERIKLGVNMIDTKAFKNQSGTGDIGEGGIQNFPNFFGGNDKRRKVAAREVGKIATKMLFGNNNGLTKAIRKNIQKSKMVVVFPNFKTGNGTVGDLAKKTR